MRIGIETRGAKRETQGGVWTSAGLERNGIASERRRIASKGEGREMRCNEEERKSPEKTPKGDEKIGIGVE